MAFHNEHNFTISVVGSVTGETWAGEFTAKKVLSHGDQIARDSYYRELLGTNPQHATGRIDNQALIIADLRVRLTKAPSFWADHDGGLRFLDDEVLQAVFDAAIKPEMELKEKRAKAAEATQKALKDAAPKD